MSIETNKAIIRRYVDQILNKQRHDLIDEFLVESVVFNGVGPSLIGRKAISEFLNGFIAAFPDWHTIIDDMVAEGNKVVVRISSSGNNHGEFQGIPATSKPYTQKAIIIFRLDNGKIVESWLQTDMMSMMQQLGLMPASQEN